MESSEIKNESPSSGNLQRRSRRVKNLCEVVELIFSQDNSSEATEKELPTTPSTSSQQKGKINNENTPRASEVSVLTDTMQTPRRSCRKSIKPTQEYDDIVRRSMRSVSKSTKKSLMDFKEEENEENMESLLVDGDDESQPKWSAAIVGKSSTKRGRRRGRPNKKETEVEVANISRQRKLDMDKMENKRNDNNDATVQEKVMSNIAGDSEDSEGNVETKSVAQSTNVIPKIIVTSPQEHKETEEKKLNETVEVVDQQTEIGHPIKTNTESVLDKTIDEIKSNETEDKTSQLPVSDEENQIVNDIIQVKKEDFENFEKKRQENEEEEKETLNEAIEPTASNSNDIIELNEEKSEKIKEEIVAIHIKEDKEIPNESFGSYLKSNKINVSDLGLIPLKDDDIDEAENKIVSTLQPNVDSEEMPSLIVLDDEEDGMLEKSNVNSNLNETFDAAKETKQECPSFEKYDAVNDSLQIFLRNEAAAKAMDEEALEMSNLKMSEDEATPRKNPREALTTTKLTSKKLPETPKQKSKPYRFPTPHCNKVGIRREPTSSNKKHPKNINFAFTTMEPKEIILRGIRKRSLSLCLDRGMSAACGSVTKRQRPMKGPLATHRQQKAVNFYSPANQTTIIDDLDKIIEVSVKKDQANKPTREISFVTTRRKRSLSLDEVTMSKSLISKIPRPEASTFGGPSSSTNSKVTRTKLPNFAAIHQKHFQQMENLVDHVARKQERSKVLISSAAKIKTVSAQKNISANRVVKNINQEKSKVAKKIDLEATSLNKIRTLNTSSATKPATKTIQKTSPLPKENKPIVEETKLPHPRDLPNIKDIKIMNKHQKHLFDKQHLKTTQKINILSNNTPAKVLTAPKTQTQKPFSLSTQIFSGPKIVKPVTNTSSSSSSSSKLPKTQDKMSSRLQRHMDLFKGRVVAEKTGVATRKMEANIRGVRSNRRFELQMQHRRNLEN